MLMISRDLQVWDACSDARIVFNNENFQECVAHIVENDLIVEAVQKQLKELPNVEYRNATRLDSCQLKKDGAISSQVLLKSGEKYTCELLVSESKFLSLKLNCSFIS